MDTGHNTTQKTMEIYTEDIIHFNNEVCSYSKKKRSHKFVIMDFEFSMMNKTSMMLISGAISNSLDKCKVQKLEGRPLLLPLHEVLRLMKTHELLLAKKEIKRIFKCKEILQVVCLKQLDKSLNSTLNNLNRTFIENYISNGNKTNVVVLWNGSSDLNILKRMNINRFPVLNITCYDTKFNGNFSILLENLKTKVNIFEYEIGFKLGNKISSAHINWKGNSMKVKLAVQLLSSSVADAFAYLSQTSIEFEKCEATIKFIRIIDEIFDFLNSRNPFAKGLKQSICIHNIQYLEKKMKNNIEYSYSLKTVTGEYLWKSKRKTFIIGLATALKSTLAIAKDLLANHSFKFILTYKFSQDAIEIFFGFMRGKFWHNNNPNCLEFKNALKSILLHNSIKMSFGNCALLSQVEDSLFAIKWNYKKPKEQNNDEIDYYLLAEQCNNTFLSLITENVLYYISGYSVKTLLQNLKCESCIRAILDTPSVHDHTYCKGDNNKSIRKFKFAKVHLNATTSFQNFIKSKSIDCQLNSAQIVVLKKNEEERIKNRNIMRRLIDIVLLLGKTGKPFRGHDESILSNQKGMFREIIDLLARYDDVLKIHLLSGPKNAQYMSNRIQNDLISSLHSVMIIKIKSNFENSFISLMVDETSDVGHCEQLSVVVRYFNQELNRPVETFVALNKMTSVTGQSIFDSINIVLKMINKDWSSVLAVCFDGASSMSGNVGGVQAKCKEQNDKILYVHCYAHCLNLVLIDSIYENSSTPNSRLIFNFLGTIQFIYNFIEGSPMRHAILQKVALEPKIFKIMLYYSLGL
ncbi:hypothetical protein QTP88_025382 [Uroleucon formosanum]